MGEPEKIEKTKRSVAGSVVSSGMDKSITVVVERRFPHPLYKKFVRKSTRLHVHDEDNVCKEGDKVLIEECRPISKTKSWRLVKVVEQAK
ncbi:MAG: 30S ribosomal protein S17 [Arenicellales bacterium]|jgi:small subunit ribosomal protein S17|nr:30S ribosomal protein S17 [Acidiferrobacteraceae bacterium]MDP6123284.1 30S ribosomal protein S17 [Arenicellales bacterium]MBT58234.1 30S ribosomal protein S17 [Acidiferrobacteraceae bacterium]MDP6290035.1 30S ribosomal protein S17 [Arenicellales bacterium]MDP6434012.1 30S ribosomal protein S17 [Arenicellales bacterium]|tara:strand:- start:4656 stop:4925 length:270 start_codon:yes stop_codon:yes gene_type:complete